MARIGNWTLRADAMENIAEGIFWLAGYFAAKVLLPLTTFGYVRVERFADKLTFGWHGFKRLPSGKIAVHHDMAAFIGLAFWIACIVAGVISWKGLGSQSPGCTRPAVSSEMPPAAPRSAPC